MKRHIRFIPLLALIWVFTSCSNTRKIPAGDALYVDVSVKVQDSLMSKREKSRMSSDLVTLTRPAPNSKSLGIRFKLWAYNHLPKFIGKKIGEEQVLLSSVDLEHNRKVLQSGLENQGYFSVVAEADTSVNRKKATVTYTVTPGPQYTIRDVRYDSSNSLLTQTIRNSIPESVLKPGDPFNLTTIKGERIRIDEYLKERGYFYFDSDYLLAQTDSTVGDNKVSLFMRVKANTPRESRIPYRIMDVYIIPNYRLTATLDDTTRENAKFFEGYYVVDQRDRYKPRLFTQSMQFDPGDVYNRTDHVQTINRLVSLGLFKFVKNRFEPVPGSDTLLNVYYYLTPQSRKSITAEIKASTKSNDLTGSSLTLGWKNRNTFRSGVLLSLNANASFEVQFGGNAQGFNTYGASLEAGLDFPRVLFFRKFNLKGGYVPHTQIIAGFELLEKQKLYTLKSFRTSLGYLWRKNFNIDHQFHPFVINYVEPSDITELFIDSAQTNPDLLKQVEKQFIIGSDYTYTYNGLKHQLAMKGRYFSGTYFSGLVDLSGNIIGLITGADVKNGDIKKILGTPFSQYVKLQADVRRYFKISNNSLWANRLIVGLGFPYGNSLQIPYIKQYFVGGNNSVRAFRSRGLGPGSYEPPQSDFYAPDQSGDIKLEINTELRAKVFSFLHGALFVDAGNIWLYNETPFKPGAQFTKDFLKELAVGAGVGLRVDVTIMIIRLDIAFPLRKPWLPENDRWVIDQIDFGSKNWRKDNIIYNLGFGYPF